MPKHSFIQKKLSSDNSVTVEFYSNDNISGLPYLVNLVQENEYFGIIELCRYIFLVQFRKNHLM